ncbi:AAA family ATPase [Vibrio sp. 10N.286.46.E10]|uniref:AAA family ATPase n=1 Tax=Vibrio sp. 10N.286.46.E10 TaxID=1884477 RepID=UPI000C83F8FF|nr:AAA family ATPase [Vibrio sp. 10N.286.46.E10]PMI20403.1 hypothetical protein BCU50_17710 [Vibrio sp. 10N.286.46.E10]
MKKIWITGLRSLVDTDVVEVKPINILVGTNSSGKSTFLRTFPLLRQSVEKRTRGPILWNGNYVDFGSYSNALHKDKNNKHDCKNIKLSFEFDYKQRVGFRKNKEKEIAISIEISSTNDKISCYTSKFHITHDDHTISFNLDKDGNLLEIDSNRLNWELNDDDLKMVISDTNTIIPIIMSNDYRLQFAPDDITRNKNLSTIRNLRQQITTIIEKYTGSKSEEKVRRIAGYCIGRLRSDQEKLIDFRAISSTKKWLENTNKWTLEDDEFLYFSGLCDLYYILTHTYEIDNQLTQTIKNVRYIAPLRASTERYYRYQDLSIDELDHRGENIAMFITSIPRSWRKKLDSWTEEHYGFTIKDKRSAGHINIQLQYGDGEISDNIADMGFGFSQVLPIIIQLWSVASGYEQTLKRDPIYNSNSPYIFAIEQPELHLHPRMQANLATIFNNAVQLGKDNNISIKLIIETHSESLISKFGDLIAKENLKEQDIQVMLFEQNRHERVTDIKYSDFNDDGILQDWPTGFFSY